MAGAMEGTNALTCEYRQDKDGRARLVLKGRLDRDTIVAVWQPSVQRLRREKPAHLIVQAGEVASCDGIGIALLVEYKQIQQEHGGQIEVRDLSPQCRELLALFEPDRLVSPPAGPRPLVAFFGAFGEMTARLLRDIYAEVSFTGEVVVKLARTALHPRSLRWRDTLLIAEKAGANGVGIVALLGFLIGVIISFQSAASMQEFGAEIYVADLVVIGLFRELGPLITAFVLASRSGSAFAAEIGTMKVDEEVDALTTMALDPVQFLVVPRVIAAICVLPLLTMFNELLGLVGSGLVMASWDVPAATFMERIREAATLGDFFSGLVKTFVFAILIAGLGCLRGLETGTGPSAVGDSATRAVVSGIIAIIVADGVFAVVYYSLGI